jgi:hypothetical protein
MAGLRRIGWATVLPVQARRASANRDILKIGIRHGKPGRDRPVGDKAKLRVIVFLSLAVQG